MSKQKQWGIASGSVQNKLLEKASLGIRSISDPEARHRAFTTVLFGVSLIFWALVFTVIYVVMGSARCALITTVTAASLLGVILLIKMSHSVQLASNLIAAIVLAALFCLSVFSGGYIAPAMIWLPAVPIIAILLCGWKPGLIWLLATTVSALTVFLLDINGALPPSDFSGKSVSLLYILGLLGIINCTTILCYIFDFNGRALRKQLEEARLAAEEGSRAKGEFVALMSHEIRTPMNGVIGMLELLDNTQVTKKQAEYVQLAKQSADSLLRILNDILDFSKMEASKLELESIPFELRDAIGDTLQFLELYAAENNLELACHIQSDVPDALVGDPGRLRQIIVNLVGNALKFTKQGEVVVRITHDRISDDRARLHFSVTDTGVGIPEEKQQRIFDAFGQADSSTTREFGGTGLGLNIASRLIEMMGGQLGLKSEVGKGTTFDFAVVFTLQSEHRAAVPPASLADLSVLVVDDNATNRFVLNEILTNWGMLATCVDSARNALVALADRAAHSQPFRLALLDVMMPGVDGWMLAEQIRSDSLYDNLPLIMLSSSSSNEPGERCETLGVVGQLHKPIKQCELLEEILKALDPQSAEPTRQPAKNIPQSLRPLRILLAEDGLINQKVALGMLEAQGHAVTLADNGAAAVRAVEQTPFDLILMDIQMPEMDGEQATALIRARERDTKRHIPIVAMTAHAIQGDRERFLAAGMDAHVPKPINPQQLYEVITQVTSNEPLGAANEDDSHQTPTKRRDATSAAKDVISTANGKDGQIIDIDCARRRIAGGDGELREVAEMLRAESSSLLHAIQLAITTGDAPRLRREAHTLKGSADIFAAEDVVNHARQIEILAKEGRLSESQAIFEQLGQHVDKMNEALSAFIER